MELGGVAAEIDRVGEAAGRAVDVADVEPIEVVPRVLLPVAGDVADLGGGQALGGGRHVRERGVDLGERARDRRRGGIES